MTKSRPALFRILVWLLWLLAAWGILQYVTHAWMLTHLFDQAQNDAARTALWRMLGWDVLYVLVAGLTLAAATGVLMWRDWARMLMRGLCVLLALYFLMTAVMLYAHWRGDEHVNADLLAQASDPRMAQMVIAKLRRVALVTLGLRVLAVPLLGWLAWFLGRQDVRSRFQRKLR